MTFQADKTDIRSFACRTKAVWTTRWFRIKLQKAGGTGKRMSGNLELLAPAGNLEICKAVIRAGADAVYVGGNRFGARAYADNFGEAELLEAIDYGHIHNRKVFLAVNTLLKNQELKQMLYSYLLPYYRAGVDAVIVQDYGVMRFVREHFPGLPIHTSTQMTVTGVDGARLLWQKGAERIVTAREMSLEEIRAIHEAVDVEIESFVHGALCYCYSGQCLLSSMIGGRSGNRGRCAQPCRLPFSVLDERQRILNNKNPYILSLKDLNTIAFLPELAESGIDSFKIEGRMKSAQYAAGVVSVYRHYMDRYLACGAKGYQVSGTDAKKLLDSGNRNGFTDGYYHQRNGADMLTGDTSSHSKASDSKSTASVETYLKDEIKEKINGKLKLFKDANAMMLVTDGVFQAEVTGAVVQQAKSRPMMRENVEEKIRKTGNTPFVFEQLEICMEDDVFVPVAELNHMRQEALEQLEQLRLEVFRRKNGECLPEEFSFHKTDGNPSVPELIVSTECRTGFDAALKCKAVTTVYLDSSLYTREHLLRDLQADIRSCTNAGKKVFYIFPPVFRKNTRDFYATVLGEIRNLELNGFVVKSYDELGFFKNDFSGKKELRIDHNMYTYSDYTKESFTQDGVFRDTVPLELNRKEVAHRNNRDSDFLVYGYLPLMVSAGCVHKNTAGCDKKAQTLYLQDRYEVKFPVKNNCGECYNSIYNAKPLFLLHHAAELKKLTAGAYRIHFVFETAQEAAHILEAYQSAFLQQEAINPENYVPDYTNGHYKRGVE